MKHGSKFVAILMSTVLGLSFTAAASATAMPMKQHGNAVLPQQIAHKAAIDGARQEKNVADSASHEVQLPAKIACAENECARAVSKQQETLTGTSVASYKHNGGMSWGRFWSMW